METTIVDFVRRLVEQFGTIYVLLGLFVAIGVFVLVGYAVYDHVGRRDSLEHALEHAREHKYRTQLALQDVQTLYGTTLEALRADVQYVTRHGDQPPAAIVEELKNTDVASLNPRHPLYTELLHCDRQQRQLSRCEQKFADAEQELSRLEGLGKVRYMLLQLRNISWGKAILIASIVAFSLTAMAALAFSH